MTKMLIIGMGILYLCSGVLSATIINIPLVKVIMGRTKIDIK